MLFFFFSSRRRHTRFDCDWSSDVCSSDLIERITGILGDVDAPIFVPIHRDGALDQRLRGKGLNTKALVNSNRPESFSLAIGGTSLGAKSHKKTADHHANYQQRKGTDKPDASAG